MYSAGLPHHPTGLSLMHFTSKKRTERHHSQGFHRSEQQFPDASHTFGLRPQEKAFESYNLFTLFHNAHPGTVWGTDPSRPIYESLGKKSATPIIRNRRTYILDPRRDISFSSERVLENLSIQVGFQVHAAVFTAISR